MAVSLLELVHFVHEQNLPSATHNAFHHSTKEAAARGRYMGLSFSATLRNSVGSSFHQKNRRHSAFESPWSVCLKGPKQGVLIWM